MHADELQEINRLRLIARVVSSTVHDINNELQVISGSAELLSGRPALGPAEQRRIETIGERTRRVADSLRRLMAYARPAPSDRRAVDLIDLVDIAVSLRTFSLNRAHIAVAVERDAEPTCRASVDGALIIQVLLNLLVNAEAALEKRQGGAIRIRVARSAGECCISVEDNGPGISAAERIRAVDSRGEAQPRPGLGGLGLPVSVRIASLHGGRLDFGEAGGSGAVVTLRLPAVA
jgi:two-component system C4-dicarboxylate transport sensor histidine kinase DctB